MGDVEDQRGSRSGGESKGDSKDNRDEKYSYFKKLLIEREGQDLHFAQELFDEDRGSSGEVKMPEPPASDYPPKPSLEVAMAWASKILRKSIDPNVPLPEEEEHTLLAESDKLSGERKRLEILYMKSRAAPETHPFIEEGFKAREAKQKIAARVAALNSMLEEKPRKRKFETAADFCRQVLWWDSVNQALIKFYETLILKAPSMMTQLRPSASDEYHRVIQEASKLLVIRTDLIDSIESAQRHDQEVIGAMHEARRVEGQLRSHFAAQRIDVNSGTAMEMQKHMRDVVGRLADFRQKLGAAMERIQLMRAKAVTEVAESMAARPDFDAFLCHASEDKAPVVLPFVKVLETAGLRPWLDAAQVGWGDSLVKAVERGLTRSRFVIVFISEAFLRKNWPEKELRSALNMEINGVKKVLPILLGVDHALLQASHPFVAEKLYKIIRPYDPSKPVPEEQLNELVEGLKQELAKLV